MHLEQPFVGEHFVAVGTGDGLGLVHPGDVHFEAVQLSVSHIAKRATVDFFLRLFGVVETEMVVQLFRLSKHLRTVSGRADERHVYRVLSLHVLQEKWFCQKPRLTTHANDFSRGIILLQKNKHII